MSTTSVWRGTVPDAKPWPALAENLSADVAIVGGGITGLTLACLLAEAGKSVVLLEARRIGLGDTGHSTGNLYQTVTGGLQSVHKKWGLDVARAVAQSRGETIDFIEQRSARIGPAAGFRRCPWYFYAGSPDARHTVSEEHDTTQAAGLPVRMAFELPDGPPAPQGQVLVLEHQAQIHPLGYVQGLAEQAAAAGCRIFEQSLVVEVDRSTHRLRTEGGHAVTAPEIVLATHSPSGVHLVHTGLLPRREYGLAFRVPAGSFPPGIFWAQGFERLSVRGLDTAQGSFAVCIGQQHKTGHGDPSEAIAKLEQISRGRLSVRDLAYSWSAQHFHSPDELPYIGQDASGTHIATGFSTDGLTYGTLAARIIADRVLGRENRWSEVYKASRFAVLKAAKTTVEETVVTAKALVKDYVMKKGEPLDSLAPGQGAIVEIDKDRVAAYRDPDGTLHTVSPVCTHMHCMVRWNAFETSWDCPCHGSRFAPDGRVLEGPATQPLQRKQLKP